jgi:hypothetical protein
MENTKNRKKVNTTCKTAKGGKEILLFAFVSLLGTLGGGCASGVGDPCLPEVIPESQVAEENSTATRTVRGFVSGESYIEASSVQCETRVCGVFNLEGDPSKPCDPNLANRCPQDWEIDKKVHCTCRCKAPESRFATCTCPSGYECCEVLERGAVGIRGSYCVKVGVCKELNQ